MSSLFSWLSSRKSKKNSKEAKKKIAIEALQNLYKLVLNQQIIFDNPESLMGTLAAMKYKIENYGTLSESDIAYVKSVQLQINEKLSITGFPRNDPHGLNELERQLKMNNNNNNGNGTHGKSTKKNSKRHVNGAAAARHNNGAGAAARRSSLQKKIVKIEINPEHDGTYDLQLEAILHILENPTTKEENALKKDIEIYKSGIITTLPKTLIERYLNIVGKADSNEQRNKPKVSLNNRFKKHHSEKKKTNTYITK